MDISIIIPTKNGSSTIEGCLKAIKNQNISKSFEIIAIDSGSSDDTLSILQKYECKIIEIKPEDFSHGYSRNLGAQNSVGNILVFLNQDAIPYDKYWLENLILGLNKTSAVFSRQIPYENTPIVEKIFLNYIYPEESRIIGIESLEKRTISQSVLFSTVCGAIKREIFLKFKFSDEIIFGEDQEFAVRLLSKDHHIKYVSNSIVKHSHSYSITRVFRRYFDAGWGLNSITNMMGFKGDAVIKEQFMLLLISLRASAKKGPYEILFSLGYSIAKSMGYALGTKANYLPKFLQKTLSHTIELKQK